MVITDVKTFVVYCYRTNFVFVKVYTDEGVTGVGEGTLEYKEYALTGGSTSCVGSGSIYTLDKDGKLVSIKTDYDPAVLDDGERSTNTAQDGTDGSVSASN